tara:strand:+ start:209 stop:466 length:258 start_codon:yes stop_codon:yes gene_type:complete
MSFKMKGWGGYQNSPVKFDKKIRGKEKEKEEIKFDLSNATIIGGESEIEKNKKEKDKKEKETNRLIDGVSTEERKEQLKKFDYKR